MPVSSARIPIKGTRHYDARTAMDAGRLRSGTQVRLVPRPDNPYDSTAVEIRLQDGTMLGHVPRERSSEFFALIRAGRYLGAHVSAAQKYDRHIDVEVIVEYIALAHQPSATPKHVDRTALSVKTTQTSTPSSPPREAQDESRWLWWLIGSMILLWLLSS